MSKDYKNNIKLLHQLGEHKEEVVGLGMEGQEHMLFSVKIARVHSSSFNRQLHEAVLINMTPAQLLNNKSECNRCLIPTIELTSNKGKIKKASNNTMGKENTLEQIQETHRKRTPAEPHREHSNELPENPNKRPRRDTKRGPHVRRGGKSNLVCSRYDDMSIPPSARGMGLPLTSNQGHDKPNLLAKGTHNEYPINTPKLSCLSGARGRGDGAQDRGHPGDAVAQDHRQQVQGAEDTQGHTLEAAQDQREQVHVQERSKSQALAPAQDQGHQGQQVPGGGREEGPQDGHVTQDHTQTTTQAGGQQEQKYTNAVAQVEVQQDQADGRDGEAQDQGHPGRGVGQAVAQEGVQQDQAEGRDGGAQDQRHPRRGVEQAVAHEEVQQDQACGRDGGAQDQGHPGKGVCQAVVLEEVQQDQADGRGGGAQDLGYPVKGDGQEREGHTRASTQDQGQPTEGGLLSQAVTLEDVQHDQADGYDGGAHDHGHQVKGVGQEIEGHTQASTQDQGQPTEGGLLSHEGQGEQGGASTGSIEHQIGGELRWENKGIGGTTSKVEPAQNSRYEGVAQKGTIIYIKKSTRKKPTRKEKEEKQTTKKRNPNSNPIVDWLMKRQNEERKRKREDQTQEQQKEDKKPQTVKQEKSDTQKKRKTYIRRPKQKLNETHNKGAIEKYLIKLKPSGAAENHQTGDNSQGGTASFNFNSNNDYIKSKSGGNPRGQTGGEPFKST